jgi:hypothetical protein
MAGRYPAREHGELTGQADPARRDGIERAI